MHDGGETGTSAGVNVGHQGVNGTGPGEAAGTGRAGSRAAWAVLIPADRYEAERLYHHDTLELTGLGSSGPIPAAVDRTAPDGAAIAPNGATIAADGPSGAGDRRPRPGDDVLVLAGDPPQLVALGRVGPGCAGTADDPDDPQAAESGALVVTYTRRSFDEPVPADRLVLAGPVTPVDRATYRRLADQVRPPGDTRSWLVSIDLPIEATSPAEAVRQFWSYVMELGPRELPAFISPYGNELAMQAFVLGVEANQDPEEDD